MQDFKCSFHRTIQILGFEYADNQCLENLGRIQTTDLMKLPSRLGCSESCLFFKILTLLSFTQFSLLGEHYCLAIYLYFSNLCLKISKSGDFSGASITEAPLDRWFGKLKSGRHMRQILFSANYIITQAKDPVITIVFGSCFST